MMNRRLGEKGALHEAGRDHEPVDHDPRPGRRSRATANLVAQHQRSVNGDIVRDMAAKVT